MPAENRSELESTPLPATCSGDMYFKVPTVPPLVLVASPESVIRATPKSVSLMRPSLVRSMLAGLMSRWMILFLCA